MARFSGVLIKQRETKSINCGDHWSESRNVGGGFVGIIKMALNKQKAILAFFREELGRGEYPIFTHMLLTELNAVPIWYNR